MENFAESPKSRQMEGFCGACLAALFSSLSQSKKHQVQIGVLSAAVTWWGIHGSRCLVPKSFLSKALCKTRLVDWTVLIVLAFACLCNRVLVLFFCT